MRTLPKIALLFTFLLLFDITMGRVAAWLVPSGVDERSFRKQSDLYHHDLRANVASQSQWGSYVHPIFTNSLGFKDASVREVPIESSEPRVLLIGDSFTEGVGYAYEETYAGLIDEALGRDGTRVLNAAAVSYSPCIYYRKVKYLIEEVGLDFDELVVFLDISDIEDEAWHYELDASGRVVDQGEQAIARFHMPERERSTREILKETLRTYSFTVRVLDTAKDTLFPPKPKAPVAVEETASDDPFAPFREVVERARGNWTHDPGAFEEYGKRGLERATASLDALHALVSQHGRAMTLVVYPWPNQVHARDLDSRQVRHFGDWSRRKGVRFVNLFPEFIDERPATRVIPAHYIPGDGHFNAAGHALVARAFLEQHTNTP